MQVPLSINTVVSPQNGCSTMHVNTGEGLSVVCTLVYPEKGPRGRLVCLYVVCPLVTNISCILFLVLCSCEVCQAGCSLIRNSLY